MGLTTSTNHCVNIYFSLNPLLNKQHDQPLFIQLTFIQLSRQLIHNFNLIMEIFLKCIFHSIVLNQSPVHFTSWKSFLKMDET